MNVHAGRTVRSPRAQQGGFVLLMVIGMLVVLVMLASVAAVTVSRMQDDQARENLRNQGLLDMYSTRATVWYLLATQRMTFGGLTVDDQMRLTADEKQMQAEGEPSISNYPVGNEIRLDSALYAGLGTSEFALQDDRGRLNINWGNPALLSRWFDRLHVAPDEQQRLSAALLDYQDADELYRLNGAEAPQYREKGLAPPPNRPLLLPSELRRVMGWGAVLKPVDDKQLIDTISVSRDGRICINTISADVLQLIPGVTPEMAQRVVALRNAQAISDEAALTNLLPTLPDGNDFISLHPGLSGTLSVWPTAATAGWLAHWTLTPFDDGGRPWRIDYEIRLPARSGLDAEPARTAATPLLVNPAAPNTR